MQGDEIVDSVLSAGGRLLTAAIVLIGGYVIAVAARRAASRVLERPKVASALGPSMVGLVRSAIYYLLLALTLAFVLIALGVSAASVATVAVVIIAIVALALQQSLANFAATVVFLMFQPFQRGELVETMGHMGTVQEILLFNTVLRLPDNRLVSLPNSKIQENGVVNYARLGRVLATISVTVAYSEDLARVKDVITAIASQDPRVLPYPPVSIAVDDLGETGVRLLVFPSVRPEHYWAVRADLREQIKARFDAEQIRFAVPPRDVRLTAQ